jgi:hypothetical protein
MAIPVVYGTMEAFGVGERESKVNLERVTNRVRISLLRSK